MSGSLSCEGVPSREAGEQGFGAVWSNHLRMRKLLLPFSLCVALLAPTQAQAAVAVTGPGGFVAGYVPPIVVIEPGEGVTYANADIAPHNFVALESFMTKKQAKKAKWCSGYDKGKCPLFWSQTISAGNTTDVLGLENLKSGESHAFYCSLHPGMKGTLIVR
jgi:plastocyanin